MTSSANDEWDYHSLCMAIDYLRQPLVQSGVNGHKTQAYHHAADFIEYNMREMEITGGNGD